MPYFVFSIISGLALLILFWMQLRLQQLQRDNWQCMMEAQRLSEKLKSISEEVDRARQDIQDL
jgi:hypothetical protein